MAACRAERTLAASLASNSAPAGESGGAGVVSKFPRGAGGWRRCRGCRATAWMPSAVASHHWYPAPTAGVCGSFATVFFPPRNCLAVYSGRTTGMDRRTARRAVGDSGRFYAGELHRLPPARAGRTGACQCVPGVACGSRGRLTRCCHRPGAERAERWCEAFQTACRSAGSINGFFDSRNGWLPAFDVARPGD